MQAGFKSDKPQSGEPYQADAQENNVTMTDLQVENQ
jgi:hypothetical protein